MNRLLEFLPSIRHMASFFLLTDKEFSMKIFQRLIDPNNKFTSNTDFIDDYNMVEIINNPSEKGSIIISNHPSFIDLTILKKQFPNCYCLTYMVDKRIFTDDEYINRFKLIPYHYEDKNGGDNVKKIIKKLIFEGKNVIVFPEGGLSENKILSPFKKGLFYLAKEFDINIIPCSINIKSSFDDIIARSFSYMLELPVLIPKIDVFIGNVIIPSDFPTFEDFYNCCYYTVKGGLEKLAKIN